MENELELLRREIDSIDEKIVELLGARMKISEKVAGYKMRKGMDIALITDAGTPAISDPGQVLVAMCNEAGIRVTSLPGACACITALTLSGFDSRRFIFEGFLPTDKKERRRDIESLKDETRTVIMYEAPHHLKKTVEELAKDYGNRKVAFCRELTKQFEEVNIMTLAEAEAYYNTNEPRGEYVLVIEGADKEKLQKEELEDWKQLTVKEHMDFYEKSGYESKEAMKMVAKDRGVSKREIYKELIE